MSTRSADRSLRMPASLQHDVDQIFKLCPDHLDAEYRELVRNSSPSWLAGAPRSTCAEETSPGEARAEQKQRTCPAGETHGRPGFRMAAQGRVAQGLRSVRCHGRASHTTLRGWVVVTDES
jgi:hypothetical protein